MLLRAIPYLIGCIKRGYNIYIRTKNHKTKIYILIMHEFVYFSHK